MVKVGGYLHGRKRNSYGEGERQLKEYQFTIKREVVIVARVSVVADNEDLARDLAMSGEFDSIEEGDRREEFTLSIESLDAVEDT